MSDINGLSKHNCPLSRDWDKHREDFMKMTSKISETHTIMNQILVHTQHLSKLDALEDIRDSLISKATGRDQVDSKIAIMIFKILGLVIATLLLTILFLLTGQKLNLFSLFHPIN